MPNWRISPRRGPGRRLKPSVQSPGVDNVVPRAPLIISIARPWAAVAILGTAATAANLLLTTLSPAPPPGQDDWPNPRTATFPVELRTWVQPVNLNLIGKDVFFAAPGQAPVYAWPNPQRGAERAQPAAAANLLTGLLAAPATQPRAPDVTGVATAKSRVAQAVFAPNLLSSTLAANQAQVPFGQDDWPNPRGYTPALALKTGNDSVTARLPIGAKPFTQGDWPNPRIARALLDDGNWAKNLLGTVLTPAATLLRAPVLTGVATAKSRVAQAAFAPNLLTSTLAGAQAPMPFGLDDWPNPRGYTPAVALKTGNDSVTARLPIGPKPFAQNDWPNPRGARPLLDDASWAKNLLGTVLTPAATLLRAPVLNGVATAKSRVAQTLVAPNLLTSTLAPAPPQVPFGQDDWPNPRVASRSITLLTKLNSGVPDYDTFFGAPGQVPNYNWTNPVRATHPVALRSWTQNLLGSTLFVPPVLPFGLDDWPNPRGYTPAIALRTGHDSVTPRLPIGPKPFAQNDWPVPRGYTPAVVLKTGNDSVTARLPIGPKPFAQNDWPVPRGPRAVVDDASWTQNQQGSTLFVPPVMPFGLDDWPNPRGYTPAIALRTGHDSVTWRLPVGPKPFAQNDWPVPRGYTHAVVLRTGHDSITWRFKIDPVYGWGARSKIGSKTGADPFQHVGSETAAAADKNVGSGTAQAQNGKIGSDDA